MTPEAAARRPMLWGIALGGLAAFGHPPVGFGAAALVGLLAAFVLAPLAEWRRAARFGWGMGFGYFALSWHWLVEPFLVDPLVTGWMAPFGVTLLAGAMALYWAGAFGLAARLRVGPVGFAVTWAAAEALRGHLFTGFPWSLPVYPFVGAVGYQAAAWVGPFGLTLVLLALAATVSRGPVPWRVGGVAALAAVCLVPMPTASPTDGPLVRVVQPNAAQDIKWDPDMIPVFLDRKLAATAKGAALTVWPEVSVPAWLSDAEAILAEAARAAEGQPLIVGAQRRDAGGIYNSAVLVGPEGGVARVYDKRHLVPYGEYMPLRPLMDRLGIYGLAANLTGAFSPGTAGAPMRIEGVGDVLPLICYESIFPYLLRAAPARPRAVVLITNDAWFGTLGGPAQHLVQARARAIEFGLPVVRSANTGISAVIDARGRVLASVPLGVPGDAAAPLPPARPETPYARWGEWPFLVLLAGLAALAWRRRA
ncbi:MAG: apolipoprotein N-acyltransferase [Shimia sp.]